MYQRQYELLNRKIKILEKPDKERMRNKKSEIKDYLLRSGVLYKLDTSSQKVRSSSC